MGPHRRDHRRLRRGLHLGQAAAHRAALQIVNQPVENWTRQTTDLLGTVKLYLDYRAPVESIRTEYKRILDESGMWDGEAWSVLVTGADDRTITVRALYSAPDASVDWSLRCLVREQLIGFLQATPSRCPAGGAWSSRRSTSRE